MALPNTIEIKFEAKGDKDLIQTIKSLDNATKSLIKAQSSLAGEGKKQVQSQNKNKSAIKRLNIELALQGSNWKKAGISAKLYTSAVKGNSLALAKVRVATKKHTADLTRQKKGLLDTSHSTRILGGSFAVLRSKMLLASFAGSIFAITIGKMAKLAGEQERAENKLSTAIGKRSDALLAFASQQQQVTAFGDEETIQAMSLIGAYTDNEKAIARLTKASMDLAVAKGMDLNSAVDLVSKSVFSSTNALSRYGVEIVGTQGSTQRLESATQALSDLYGGQAEKDADTYLGSMKQLGNSLGDLGEDIGVVVIPMVKLFSSAIKTVADAIDTEDVKAYGTALGGLAIGYLAVSRGAVIATKSMALLNKISKKNLIIFGATMAVGALIDKFNLFSGSSTELTEELKALEGALGDMETKQGALAISLNNEIELLKLKKDLMADGNLSLQDRMELIDKEQELLKTASLSDEEQKKKSIGLDIQRIALEEKIKEAKLKTISSSIGAMGDLNKAMKGSAKVSKRLAQAQAIIDTYAGANNALKTGVPPWNFIAMASVIATGLANVANIEAQQFAKGGEFVTNKPELIMVGEAGREHVQITPVDRPEDRALGGGVTVNIMGGIVQEDYITNTLIPAINSSGQALA
jgi:hypothetical protein